MKILSFDQSTRISGWSVFMNCDYVKSGIIDLSKIKDTEERTKKMGIQICDKILEVNPDIVIIENIQNQSNTDTVIKLARLQGIIIGFANAHNIDIKILSPSVWRKHLMFKQGAGVKRKELKQQSIDYVKKKLGLSLTDDESDACCLGLASISLFGLSNDDVYWGEQL